MNSKTQNVPSDMTVKCPQSRIIAHKPEHDKTKRRDKNRIPPHRITRRISKSINSRVQMELGGNFRSHIPPRTRSHDEKCVSVEMERMGAVV